MNGPSRQTDSCHAINRFVFISSALSISAFGLVNILYPAFIAQWLQWAQSIVSAVFGWWYMLLIVACLGFVIWLAVSRHGKVVLGPDGEPPQFGYVAWVSMLFSSGIGIALLYYGAYEPLDHFLHPPDRPGGTIDAARNAMVLSFLHWGIHGWALYALVGVALGFFAYRQGLPLALRSALEPVFGRHTHGMVGNFVDGFGILATFVSMVTNLGIGALIIQSGLSYLFDTPNNPQTLITIVLVMMAVGTLGLLAGVEKGIAWLSNLNTRLLCLLLLFVLFTGPTRYVLESLVQNIGDYLSAFVHKSFDMYVNQPGGAQWMDSWTLFYWAWWIAWAPFVGMFVARISRGRTIREVVLGVMLIPLGFTLAWLSIFGNTAIHLVFRQGQTVLGDIAGADAAMTLFKLLEYLPGAPWIAGAAVVVGFVLFLSPVDSGTLMISNLSMRHAQQTQTHDQDAPMWMRVFWSGLITVVSIGLLLAGKFGAMQTAVVLCGLPFSAILLFYMIGLAKALSRQ